jgi:phage shock protein C
MKKLYRSRTRIIAGVCGGLAKYLELDSVVIRLIAALSLFFTCCTMFFVYLIAWLIIPEEPAAAE